MNLTGCTEELFRELHGVGVHTTRKNLAGVRNHNVVSTSETRNGVEQNHDVLLAFHKAFGFFENHVGHAGVVLRRFIERRCNHFGLDFNSLFGCLFLDVRDDVAHFGDFFRAFVNQERDEDNFRMVLRDSACHVLQENCLTGTRRSENNTALALTNRREQVHNAGAVFRFVPFEVDLFFRVNRGQVFECHAATHLVRFFKVHAVNAAHREVLILFARSAHKAFNRIANLEVELTNKVLAHVNVVRAGLVVLIRHAEEPVTLRSDFENAFRINDVAFVFEALQNVVEGLLAHSAEVHFLLHGEFLELAHGELAELEPVFLSL